MLRSNYSRSYDDAYFPFWMLWIETTVHFHAEIGDSYFLIFIHIFIQLYKFIVHRIPYRDCGVRNSSWIVSFKI